MCERVLEKGQRERETPRDSCCNFHSIKYYTKIAINLLRLSWKESGIEHRKENSHNDGWSAGKMAHTV